MYGLSRDHNREIQAALTDLGYSPGPADGLPGAKTKSAIQEYQTDNNFPATGEPSLDLLKHLQSQLASSTSQASVAINSLNTMVPPSAGQRHAISESDSGGAPLPGLASASFSTTRQKDDETGADCSSQFVTVESGEERCGFRLTAKGQIFLQDRVIPAANPLATSVFLNGTVDRVASRIVLMPLSPSGRYRIISACGGNFCGTILLLDRVKNSSRRIAIGKNRLIDWVQWSDDERFALLIDYAGAHWLSAVDTKKMELIGTYPQSPSVKRIDSATFAWVDPGVFKLRVADCSNKGGCEAVSLKNQGKDEFLRISGAGLEVVAPMSSSARLLEKKLPLDTSWGQSGGYELNINPDKKISPCAQDAYANSKGDKQYLPGCTAIAVGQLINYHFTHGYQDGWLDRILENVEVYPRPWAKGWGLLPLIGSKNPACVSAGWDTLNSYPNTIDYKAPDKASELINFLWRVGIGLDLNYESGLTTSTKYWSEQHHIKDLGDWGATGDVSLHGVSLKIGALLKDRFRFNVTGSSPEVNKLNQVAHEIKESIDTGNPLILSLSGNKGDHNALIYGYRQVAVGKQNQYEYLINMGWGDTDQREDEGSNKWYPGDGPISVDGTAIVFDRFVVLLVSPLP
jgi:hypothetical protein